MSSFDPITLTFTDERFGDTFVLDVDRDGTIHSIVRYVDRVGRDPIYYEAVSELPHRVQAPIEELIQTKCKTNSPQ